MTPAEQLRRLLIRAGDMLWAASERHQNDAPSRQRRQAGAIEALAHLIEFAGLNPGRMIEESRVVRADGRARYIDDIARLVSP